MQIMHSYSDSRMLVLGRIFEQRGWDYVRVIGWLDVSRCKPTLSSIMVG